MIRPAELRAVRLPLDSDWSVDPFTLAGADGIVFLSEGRVLVGLGCAATLELPAGLDRPGELHDVGRLLAAIPCDDRFNSDVSDGICGSRPGRSLAGRMVGGAVLAFGSLPFERSAPASLIVPAVVFAREPTGQQWVTMVASDGDLPHDPDDVRAWLGSRVRDRRVDPVEASNGLGAEPTARQELVSVSADDSLESFAATVEEALLAIHRGALAKVVLARRMEAMADGPIDIPSLLRRWHRIEPDCAIFSMPGADGQFVGASPELLIERSGARVRSVPLAGTTDRTAGHDGADEDSILPRELFGSEKDATEHRLVVETIADRLRPLCSVLEVPPGPELVHLHNMTHFGTALTGTLVRTAGGAAPSALELVAALHPTPAVGGVPAEAAASLIARLEPRSRGGYAGPVGYLDSNGDGRWVLGIRSASVRGRAASLAAGVGIVDGSDPRAELAETNLKFNAVFDALAPGFRLSLSPARPVRDIGSTRQGRHAVG